MNDVCRCRFIERGTLSRGEELTLTTGRWTLSTTTSTDWPYQIEIIWPNQRDRPASSFLTKGRWPGPVKGLFCRRVTDEVAVRHPDLVVLKEIERVPILTAEVSGSIHPTTLQGAIVTRLILDRPHNRECVFTIRKKRYKDDPDKSYEHIFWYRQALVPASVPALRQAAPGAESAPVHITVDILEKEGWTFSPNWQVSKKRLTVGNYVLYAPDHHEVRAVIERETLSSFFRHMTRRETMYRTLTALAMYPHAALVIEATYADLLNPQYVPAGYTSAMVAQVVADLEARYPSLKIVYAGSRHDAQQWVQRYFAALWARTPTEPGVPRLRDRSPDGTAEQSELS